MEALVVIPAYNEEGHIGKVVAGVLAQGIPCLVVDDRSDDRTIDIARGAGAEVVEQRRHLGLGPTIRRGYEEALQRGAKVIVQLDADGQYDPAEIPSLLAPIKAREADMVLGARLENVHYKMPATKRFGNRAFSTVLRWLTRSDVQDGQTGFRAMHREVLEHCLPINEFSYTQEMIIRTAREGFTIKSVPVQFYARYDGKSRLFHNPIDFAFKGWWIIIRTIRDYTPFKFFFWPGLMFVLASIVPGFIAVAHFIENGQITGRIGTLIGSAVLFLFGTQMIFLGLLADMIRTHTKF